MAATQAVATKWDVRYFLTIIVDDIISILTEAHIEKPSPIPEVTDTVLRI